MTNAMESTPSSDLEKAGGAIALMRWVVDEYDKSNYLSDHQIKFLCRFAEVWPTLGDDSDLY